MEGACGKVVRHRCGYALWVRVLGHVEGLVVVEYRDGGRLGTLVYLCPGCGKPLKLWWDAPVGAGL